MAEQEKRVAEALSILADLGMPRGQQNERTALCLLALVDVGRRTPWKDAGNPLMGITPIMEWCRARYGRDYAPNTRETFRRQSMHQFVAAGVALYNPDKPDRPVNSPGAVYQIESGLLEVLRSFGKREYAARRDAWLQGRPTLAERYARERDLCKVPLAVGSGKEIRLSSGDHSQLIRAIVEEFAPRFVPGGQLAYVGDTGDKWGHFDRRLLESLGVVIDNHGKMPDVVLYLPEKNWLVLVESVTSHGPVNGKRHDELTRLFAGSRAGLVFVSAFPTRRVMTRYLESVSWETEVWVADAPSHLIHFNGTRFLGPY